MTRGLFSADPRIEPTDLACGFSFCKRTAACRRVLIVLPAPREPDPRIRPAGPKLIQNLPLPDENLSRPRAILRSYVIVAPRKNIPDSNFSRTRRKVLIRESRVGRSRRYYFQVHCRPSKFTKASLGTHCFCIAECNNKHDT